MSLSAFDYDEHVAKLKKEKHKLLVAAEFKWRKMVLF